MTLTLELPPEKEARLRQKALAQGRQAESYVADLVLRDIESDAEAQIPQGSLAEVLAGRIGLFESDGPGYEAQEAKEAFAKHLSERRQSGGL